MVKTALTTGASNGIGLELAKVHASTDGDLVLVARNKSKLDELKIELEKQFKIKVSAIGKDLSSHDYAKEVAVFGYSSMIKGKTIAIHGYMSWILANSVRFFPEHWW